MRPPKGWKFQLQELDNEGNITKRTYNWGEDVWIEWNGHRLFRITHEND